jgi:hypothetical protein
MSVAAWQRARPQPGPTFPHQRGIVVVGTVHGMTGRTSGAANVVVVVVVVVGATEEKICSVKAVVWLAPFVSVAFTRTLWNAPEMLKTGVPGRDGLGNLRLGGDHRSPPSKCVDTVALGGQLIARAATTRRVSTRDMSRI